MIRKFYVKNHISIKMTSSITLMNDSSVLTEQEAHIQKNSLCMSARVREREREKERERERDHSHECK